MTRWFRICGAAGVLAIGLIAAQASFAQAAGPVHQVGLLSSGRPDAASVEGFRQGLRDVGLVEGRNVAIHYRFAEGNVDRLPGLAAELVAARVAVIAAGPTPAARAAVAATRKVPIVMLGAADPVELGLITTLARPGGNVTGLAWSANLEVIAKGLELLKEAMPSIRLVGVLWTPSSPAQVRAVDQVRSAARSMGLQLQLLEIRKADDLDGAFAAMAGQRADAVLVVTDALFVVHRTRLAELEAKYRLPSMHGLRQNVEAGSVMSYGPNTVATWRRAGYFVDKILKGMSPADLPVEQPESYELVINERAAKALGLKIPQSLLLRADQVIQ